MHSNVSAMARAEGRMSGPPQRGGRSAGTRGSATQAFLPHPLEYPLYYAN